MSDRPRNPQSFGDFVDQLRSQPSHSRNALFRPPKRTKPMSEKQSELKEKLLYGDSHQLKEDDEVQVPPPPPPEEEKKEGEERNPFRFSPCAAIPKDTLLTPERNFLPPRWSLSTILREAFPADTEHHHPSTYTTSLSLLTSLVDTIPLRFRIDVIYNGAMFDSMDQEEGLWSPMEYPISAVPRKKDDDDEGNGDTALQSSILSGRKRIVDAVNKALSPIVSSSGGPPQKGNLAISLLQILAGLSSVSAKTGKNQDHVLVGKEASRCAVQTEHPSTSRIHGVLLVGYPGSKESGAALSCGLWYIDLGSANGSYQLRRGDDLSSTSTAEQQKDASGGGDFEQLAPFTPYPLEDGAQLRFGYSDRRYTIRLQTVRDVYNDDDARRMMRLREAQLEEQQRTSVRVGFGTLDAAVVGQKRPRLGEESEAQNDEHRRRETDSLQAAAKAVAQQEQEEHDEHAGVFASLVDGGVGNVDDRTVRSMTMEYLERRMKRIEQGIIDAVQAPRANGGTKVSAAATLHRIRTLERELMGVQGLIVRKKAMMQSAAAAQHSGGGGGDILRRLQGAAANSVTIEEL